MRQALTLPERLKGPEQGGNWRENNSEAIALGPGGKETARTCPSVVRIQPSNPICSDITK